MVELHCAESRHGTCLRCWLLWAPSMCKGATCTASVPQRVMLAWARGVTLLARAATWRQPSMPEEAGKLQFTHRPCWRYTWGGHQPSFWRTLQVHERGPTCRNKQGWAAPKMLPGLRGPALQVHARLASRSWVWHHSGILGVRALAQDRNMVERGACTPYIADRVAEDWSPLLDVPIMGQNLARLEGQSDAFHKRVRSDAF